MSDKEDDIILLNLISEGDKLAFRHLFETYFTPLCRFMHLYVRETTIVEELALDIFTYLWEHRETLQIQISLKAYLFQAARNKCLNTLRQKILTLRLDDADFDIAETNVMSLETDELYQLIQEAVLALPDKCREVFQLSRNENRSNQEIATQLNISVKTVEAQVTKALKRIKDFLGDSYSFLW
ncbi:MAG: RNA polymerase sigma-70 factor [Paludibacter sp.]|nr:RNA polymerase sigma-70 factor [Paludibacter sp.]